MLENWRRDEKPRRGIIEILLQQISYSGKAFHNNETRTRNPALINQKRKKIASFCSSLFTLLIFVLKERGNYYEKNDRFMDGNNSPL